MIDLEKLESLALRAGLPEHAGIALVPKGVEAVDLAQYDTKPKRHTGEYNTTRLAHFLDYIQTHAANEALTPQIYVDGDVPSARAIMHPGDLEHPEWHDWTARVTLASGDAFVALSELCYKDAIKPDTLVDFIDDWGIALSFTSGINDVKLEAARAQFADCTVETVRSLRTKREDFAREKTGFEKLSVQAGLPNRLTLYCEVWRGLPARSVSARIQAAEAGGAAAIKLTLIGWPDLHQKLLEEFEEAIRKADTGATVYSGSFTRDDGR